MLVVIARRLVMLVPILLGISVLTFVAMNLIPGDLAVLLIGPDGVQDPVVLANIRREYGLDQPLAVQYLRWLGNVVQGDFGDSLRLKVPVLGEIVRRLPVTLELAVLSLAFALVVGGTVGVLAATRGPFWRTVGRTFTIAGVAVPNFLLGTLLILYGGRYLPGIPTLRYVSFGDDPARHLLGMIYPVIALGTGLAAVIAENTMSAVRETIGHEYVRVGRAKGLNERAVLVRYVLRNGLIPIITVTGLQAGVLLGGTIITETIFALPGLGRLALSAVTLRDYPLMQGIVIVVATMVLVTNLIADLAYAAADPRIRIS
ncbi:MAG: ABC transporter permease [Thermomicrobiales bacterium]